MHWFWRAAIAVGVGWMSFVLCAASFVSSWQTVDSVWKQWIGIMLVADNHTFSFILLCIVPAGLMALAGFGMATLVGNPSSHRETRCRKCNYILRGITEPRCPECGEAI
jgi:hypothetical protein